VCQQSPKSEKELEYHEIGVEKMEKSIWVNLYNKKRGNVCLCHPNPYLFQVYYFTPFPIPTCMDMKRQINLHVPFHADV
jgi:hypothetical protein